jgi:anti-sigma regulatory factor (Ser/Thr protein kinase)
MIRTNGLSERYPAEASSVATARDAVAGLAASVGVDRERLESIQLAVSEVMTNAIQHGYRGRPGQIELTAAISSGELWVLVADNGCGFQTPAERPGLGWGLPLVAYASDHFVIAERPGGGTSVRMRFRIAAGRAQKR